MASLDPYPGALGSRLAKHLLRRATFNITQHELPNTLLTRLIRPFLIYLHPSNKNLNQPIHYVNGDLTSTRSVDK